MITKTLKSTEARTQFREILSDLSAGRETVIEHYNRPVGVLVPYAQWQAWKRQRRERHRQISQEMDAGNYLTGSEVEAMLKRDGLLP